MTYMITFYTRYWEQILEVWQCEFGMPAPGIYQNHCIITMKFWDDMKLYEDTRQWLTHLEATGFVRHLEYNELEEAPF